MPRDTRPQTNFTGGEWSPTASARIDIDKYNNSCQLIQNFWNHQVGGLMFRPGTIYAAPIAYPAAGPVNLLSFIYSSSQAYAIEAGNQYFRFYTGNGQLLSGGNPVQLTTPYALADVFSLRSAQDSDTMYLVSTLGTYQMQKLVRLSATQFAINPVITIGGPFRATNISTVTITPSANTNTVTLTATVPAWAAGIQYTQGAFVTNGGNTYVCVVPNTSSSSFANDLAAGLWKLGAVFNAGHVGSIWGVGASAGVFGTVVITAYNSPTSVGGYVQNNADGSQGVLNTLSYVFTVSGITTVPAKGSIYTNNSVAFTVISTNISGSSGTIRATGVSVPSGSGTLTLSSGTGDSTISFSAYTSATATTYWAEGAFSNYRGWPTCNIFYEQRLYYGMGNTFYGSTIQAFDDFSAGTELATDAVDYQMLEELQNNIQWMCGSTFAMKAGTSDGTFFISSGTQNLPITPSNVLAQKHTGWGSSNLAARRLFDAIYYASRDNMQIRELKWYLDIEADRSVDMNLVADHIFFNGGGAGLIDIMTFPTPRILVPRDDGQLCLLTRNIEQQVQPWARTIMGSTSGGPGILESLVVIPTATGSDQIWCEVYRVINGTPTRFIEYFTPERFTNPWDAVRMDAASVYNVPITMTGATQSAYCTITAPGHGLSNGNQVKLDGILGMTQLNGNFYLVTNATTNNFNITDLAGNAVNSTAFGSYQSGGQVRLMVTTITGLSYLNGETVVVSCDGGLPGKQQVFTVAGGQIVLPTPAAVVNVGLPYQGLIQLQKFSGTAQGKMTRIWLATVRVFNSSGLQIGTDLTKLSPWQMGTLNDPLGHAKALVTDDLEIRWQTGWSKTDSMYLVQNVPMPLFICGAIFRDEWEDLN